MHGTDTTPFCYGFGPLVQPGGTLFRLWAPLVESVTLKLCPERTIPMQRREGGWFETHVEGVGAGQPYLFVLPDGSSVPDPASRWQPDGVLGPSVVIAEDFAWTDHDWRGRPWHETVICEIHIGSFTDEGSFRAAIERLDALAALGVTAIEIMPVHSFPGRWGWGYDGVCLYAPFPAYGSPDDLRALVDAAHAKGLMVLLDVVYNHFGPEGNLMPKFMPLLSERHEGEFGTPPNLDGDDSGPIRRFLIENALYWLESFHCDGLRLDASHDIPDESETHFLAQLSAAVQERFRGRRHVHLVLENSHNQARWLDKDYRAQWDDDIHHALDVAVSGQKGGFYTAITEPLDLLVRALAEGFAFQEQEVPEGIKPGEPSAHLPPTAFIAYVQNHDQVGNRPDGARATGMLSPGQVRAMATLVLLGPTIPLLFMGEEWGASTPFHYFSDLEAGLRDTIRQARHQFLSTWELDDSGAPDPFARTTFEGSRLDWSERENEPHRSWLDFYGRLLETRTREIVPRLDGIAGHAGQARRLDASVIAANWRLSDGSRLRVIANLGAGSWTGAVDVGRRIWLTGDADAESLGPWSVVVGLGDNPVPTGA